MIRVPCSVIVTAGGDRRSLRTCLSALRPTLRGGDDVVCVIPAGRDDLRTELRGARWLTVLDEAPADQADRWSAGLAATTHPVVVLLDGDVCVTPHWLDPVTAVFTDPEVVAAGPRCHLSFGPQAVELPDDARQSLAAFQRHARRWRQEHRGRVTDVDRLGPVCVAIRRSALDGAGGPTVDLPYGELRSQGRILLVEGALVGHLDVARCALRTPVPADSPLLSASLIVRDEEEVLANCLTSLAGFVDEIVVYDTGSTDRTRQIARDHGAIVIEGYWNDHFGDARNRSLAHCRGIWILQIDADEILSVTDRTAVRAELRGSDAPAVALTLENLHDDQAKGTVQFRLLRAFRRDRGRYAGRLHEQIVDQITGQPLIPADLTGVTLTHHGYTQMRLAAKNKGVRNARLAEMALKDGISTAELYSNLARSYSLAGDFDAVIEACRTGLAAGGTRATRVIMLKSLISAQLQTGRLAEANTALSDLRRIAVVPVTASFVEVTVRYLENDLDRALTILRELPANAKDDCLEEVGRNRLADIEIYCLTGLGRHAEAAELLRDRLRAGQLPVTVAHTAAVLREVGSGIAEIAALFPSDRLRGILYAVNEAPESIADELLDALWTRYPGEPVVLVLGSRIAVRLPLTRVIEWSWRLRQHGRAENCTLVAVAGDPARPPRERVLAAAAAVEMFADGAALPLLHAALAEVPAGQNDLVLAELSMLAPGLAAQVEPAESGT